MVEYMLKKGYTPRDLETAGLAKRSENTNKYFDLFRNRLIFPIFAYNGDVVGFGGRALDDGNPKYLNSPETDIFLRGKIFTVYIKQKKQLEKVIKSFWLKDI